MNDTKWHQLIESIQGDDIERMVEASEHLYKEAEDSDVPRLLKLLEDDSFVVREAAAWPLASVGGADALPALFLAYKRGFDEGLDNDGFTTALIELVELNRGSCSSRLVELQGSSNPDFRRYATWLLEFC
ncbi:MAG: HEAT repeat domain-containing protein [Acidobacteriota bacterium]